MDVKTIAKIYTDFPEKFGVPRQSGLVPELKGRIVFEPEFRNPEGVKGLEGFSHLWLLWRFDVPASTGFNATVRPPRLGGNETMGVFATRSPFRPNPIGLSSVKLDSIEFTEEGPVITVLGADLRNGTEILDIKPYLPYADSHPEALEGFTSGLESAPLSVVFEVSLPADFDKEKESTLIKVLSLDPRPHYQNDETRVYGMAFAGFNIKFKVSGKTLTVIGIENQQAFS
ncbi:MAG: tRNA (N6-threonylcarbamoyladenosine(37)-N6)-methyltransferase TrmO [Lachnospiraceae bacterium]|nr:tRNA (N6-threonylcarbamoyladenosine(37)-N6)-methyltransferase TrmO [Lachnospiraceae bacterium]